MQTSATVAGPTRAEPCDSVGASAVPGVGASREGRCRTGMGRSRLAARNPCCISSQAGQTGAVSSVGDAARLARQTGETKSRWYRRRHSAPRHLISTVRPGSRQATRAQGRGGEKGPCASRLGRVCLAYAQTQGHGIPLWPGLSEIGMGDVGAVQKRCMGAAPPPLPSRAVHVRALPSFIFNSFFAPAGGAQGWHRPPPGPGLAGAEVVVSFLALFFGRRKASRSTRGPGARRRERAPLNPKGPVADAQAAG